MSAYIFDNTCLSHFARAGKLSVLDQLTSGQRRLMPNEVAKELRRGLEKYPVLETIFHMSWLETIEVDFPATIYAASYKGELGGEEDQHLGESEVLGWLRCHDGVGIIDERPATRLAERDNLRVRDTLSVIVAGFKARLLTRVESEGLVDALAETDMRLPVDGAGLFALAYEKEWLP